MQLANDELNHCYYVITKICLTRYVAYYAMCEFAAVNLSVNVNTMLNVLDAHAMTNVGYRDFS